jgi:Concanavalin A-like lectin/glucanases superfamily
MRMRLVASLLLFAGSAQSWGRESLLDKHSDNGVSETRSGVFRTNSTRRYVIKECKGHALTVSAWIWLSNPHSSFFAANDAFFHGLVFGLERSKDDKTQRMMTCLGTGKAWEKVGGIIDCRSGCWNHLTATIEPAGLVTEYLNGQLVTSTRVEQPIEIIPGTSLSVMFGSESSSAGISADTELGRLGNFEIYDDAMSSGEVKALYDAGHEVGAVPAAPLYPIAAGVGLVFGLAVLAFRMKPRAKKILVTIPEAVRPRRRIISPY